MYVYFMNNPKNQLNKHLKIYTIGLSKYIQFNLLYIACVKNI